MTVPARSDRVAACATGIGIGLITFMVTWLVGARLTELIWGPPSSATVAMAIAVLVGILTSIVAGSRLLRTVGAETGPVSTRLTTSPAEDGHPAIRNWKLSGPTKR